MYLRVILLYISFTIPAFKSTNLIFALVHKNQMNFMLNHTGGKRSFEHGTLIQNFLWSFANGRILYLYGSQADGALV